MDDPLKLNAVATPKCLKRDRSAPHPFVLKLYQRLLSNCHADPIEHRVTLLTHLVFSVYRDLKETLNDE